MNRGCIIVAGGRGERMGGSVAKQFATLADIPIVVHTLRRLMSYDPNMSLVLVIPSSLSTEQVWQMIHQYVPAEECTMITITHGGNSRSESVYNGLSALSQKVERVGIHDAVRPFLHSDMLARLYDREDEAVIPVVNVVDSLRYNDSHGSRVIERSSVVAVQTPQVFDRQRLVEAYEKYIEDIKSGGKVFTDDASLYSYYWHVEPSMVEGDVDNIKLTTPRDMATGLYILSK